MSFAVSAVQKWMDKGNKRTILRSESMRKILCKFAHWILDNYEPIEIMGMKIRTKGGTYKVDEVIQNHDFSEMTLKAKRKTISFSA